MNSASFVNKLNLPYFLHEVTAADKSLTQSPFFEFLGQKGWKLDPEQGF